MKFFRQYRAKLNLLLLAIFLWLFVVTGREYELVIEVPIVVKNIIPGKMVVSEIPQSALVQFKGVGRGLIALQTYEKGVVELDLSTINYFYDYPITLATVHVSSNLKVEPLQILSPDTVKIILEKVVEAMLPVEPVLDVTLQPGYVIAGEVMVNPAKVMVAGPSSLMKDLDKIPTQAYKVENLRQDIMTEKALNLPFEQLSTPVHKVTIHASVERLTEMHYLGIPIEVINAPENYRVNLEPESISVKVSGPVSLVKNLSSENFKANIKFEHQWSNDITKTVPEVIVPEGIVLIDMDPDTVIMTLSIK